MTTACRHGRPERRRLLVAALALGTLGAPGSGRAASSNFGVTELMQRLASLKSGNARFVERREVRELDRTLVSSGRLRFEAPDTFVRETLEPRLERMAVAGNRVTLTQGGRSRTMQLDASPEASVIVEAIRGTLTGNRAALERLFTTDVSGTPERWTLALVPREPSLRGQVARVRVRGTQGEVAEVEVLLADGDRSVMTIERTSAGAGNAARERSGNAAAERSASAAGERSGNAAGH